MQIDARREEFRKYLEKEGILESLTKVLVIHFTFSSVNFLTDLMTTCHFIQFLILSIFQVALYEEPDKPSDALSFVRNNFASSEMQTMRAQVDNLTKENEQLKTKITTLETDKTALEKKISEMEEAASAAKEEEKKEESISSPKPVSPKPASLKPIEEGEVSNETPQETSVSAEESTTSPIKEASSDVPVETQPAVEDTKSTDEVVPPVAKEAEQPNSSEQPASEAMETDAPEPEPNAS